MQGITVALSPTGIQYFVQMLTAPGGSVNAVLSGMKPANRIIPINNFDYEYNQGMNKKSYTTISVNLSNGNVSGLNPTLQSFQQQPKGTFQIVVSSGAFNANYSWEEDFTEQDFYFPRYGPTWVACEPNINPTPYKNTYPYVAGISSLGITANFSFAYNASTNTYTLPLTSITATAGSANANIPGSSIIQDQVNGYCVQSHVDGATVDSIDDIDFKSTLQSAFGGYLASIPASGQLTPDADITFAFGVGDSQLAFPNDQGLTVGVTGIATYKGTPYSPAGTPLPDLPVPAVPTDGHHLCMYVSDYVLNGLFWAYQQAGKLDGIYNPNDLTDPDVLTVNQGYEALIPELSSYDGYAMQAQVHQIDPPQVTFQSLYAFTPTVLANLQDPNNPNYLKPNVYKLLQGIANRAFLTKDALEYYLDQKKPPFPQLYFAQVEAASLQPGAHVHHNIQYTISIPTAPPLGDGKPPWMEFSVTREDFLPEEKLALGITTIQGSTAQTLQFQFDTISYQASFQDSNFLSSLEQQEFVDLIWSVVGEQKYVQLLQAMGQAGTPLPIMQGFQFLFEQASLTIESGFISILSNVEFKG